MGETRVQVKYRDAASFTERLFLHADAEGIYIYVIKAAVIAKGKIYLLDERRKKKPDRPTMI